MTDGQLRRHLTDEQLSSHLGCRDSTPTAAGTLTTAAAMARANGLDRGLDRSLGEGETISPAVPGVATVWQLSRRCGT